MPHTEQRLPLLFTTTKKVIFWLQIRETEGWRDEVTRPCLCALLPAKRTIRPPFSVLFKNTSLRPKGAPGLPLTSSHQRPPFLSLSHILWQRGMTNLPPVLRLPAWEPNLRTHVATAVRCAQILTFGVGCISGEQRAAGGRRADAAGWAGGRKKQADGRWAAPGWGGILSWVSSNLREWANPWQLPIKRCTGRPHQEVPAAILETGPLKK